jgi:hypothetical protein
MFTGSDGASVFDARGNPVAVRALRRPGTGVDLLRLHPGCKLPACPVSGCPARPNVVMFGDNGVVMDVIDQQEASFQAWLGSVPKSARLAIVEVGAGKAIPTIRHTSEAVLRAYPAATLVRINLDDSDAPAPLRERCISVGGMGALEALLAVQAEMHQMHE